jgi:hypothetical protein
VCERSRLVQVVFVLTVISSRIIIIHSCAHHQSRGYWRSPWRSDRASATRCGKVSAVVSGLATTFLTAGAVGKRHRRNFIVHGQCSSQWATTVVTIAVPDFVAVTVSVADTDNHTTASRLLLLASKNPNLLCYSCIAAAGVVVVDCRESKQGVVQGFEPDEDE